MKEAVRYIFRGLYMMLAFLLMFLFIMYGSKLSLFADGFAVDSNGFIYVGDIDDIIVYNEKGERQRSIPINTEKCTFTISSDMIVRNLGDRIEFYDLNGSFLRSVAFGTEEAALLSSDILYQSKNNTFEREDGTRYEMRSLFGRKMICVVENDMYEPLVKMPLRDYLMKIGAILLWLTFGLCAYSLVKDVWAERLEEVRNNIKFQLKLK